MRSNKHIIAKPRFQPSKSAAGHRLVATARRKESLANLPQSENVLSLSLDVTNEE